jgi:hypothetical protein
MNNQTQEALKMAIEWVEGWKGIAPSKIELLRVLREALEQPTKLTRLEVIDNNGRAYVNMAIDKLEFSYQDEGRTLKIFTNGAGAIQPAQEPVAFTNADELQELKEGMSTCYMYKERLNADCIPLYTKEHYGT